jgi:hypothetical protein
MFSQKLPLGEISALGAIGAAAARRGRYIVPVFYRWYLLYALIGVVGLLATPYPELVTQALIEVIKFMLIGLAACNILVGPRAGRVFAIGYLALFALFPVRGALYNYLHGITHAGRISWNFFFSNPNDLAMACFLPLGLCGYLICTERQSWVKRAAWIGLPVLVGVQMLTASRGAMVALGAGLLYFVFHTKRRLRAVMAIGALIAIAATLAPDSVWIRVAGLAKLGSGDIAAVDPEGSASGRATLMEIALGIAHDHPMLGIGFGAYAAENARVTRLDMSVGKDERGARDAHSSYIRAAAETGYVGAACVIAYVFGSILGCRTNRRAFLRAGGAVEYSVGMLALEAATIAYAIGAVVNSAERSTYFMWQFVLPWLLTTILRESAQQAGNPGPQSGPRGVRREIRRTVA